MSTITHRGSTEAAEPIDAANIQATTRLGNLLERSASGDTAAFAVLYSETAPQAFGLALRVMRNHSLAEDVIQEAYLKIWHTAARFDRQQGNCQGWIFTIVHRTAIDHVRSAQARSVREDRHHLDTSDPDRADDDLTHDLARASMDAGRARDAVARLSRVQQEALGLAYFDGYTYSEVARLLGVPPGTVKSRIRDGLIRLRESMVPPAEFEVTP